MRIKGLTTLHQLNPDYIKSVYDDRFIPIAFLQKLIGKPYNIYLLKQLGAGLTYGVLGLKGNIVIVVPTRQIIKDKEALRNKFTNGNLLFIYGGSKNKISDISNRKAGSDNLVIMCTADKFVDLAHLVEDFTWIIDESHTIISDASYRKALARIYDLLKDRSSKTVHVTATPPQTIPDIFLHYKFWHFYNPNFVYPKINVTYNIAEVISEAKKKINSDNTTTLIFSNEMKIFNHFMNMCSTSAIVGGKLRPGLVQHDNTGAIFDPKQDPELYLLSSAGTEGCDIFTVRPAHIYIFINTKNDATTFTLPQIIQACGRARNGWSTITLVIADDNKKNKVDEESYSFEELCEKSVVDAKKLYNEGSTGKIDYSRVYEVENSFYPNVFAFHGIEQKRITQELFNTGDEKEIAAAFAIYGVEVISVVKKKAEKVGKPKLPSIRERIDNCKRVGLEECEELYTIGFRNFKPLERVTTSPTIMKILLLAIYELKTGHTLNASNRIESYLDKVDLSKTDSIILFRLKESLNLRRQFLKDHRKTVTKASLHDFKKKLLGYSYEKVIKKYGKTDGLKISQGNKRIIKKVHIEQVKIDNDNLLKNSLLYILMFAFGILKQDKGLVKHRRYNLLTRFSDDKIADLTYGAVWTVDITSCFPQLIDQILGSKIGLDVYENLMNTINCNRYLQNITRDEAKKMFNAALNTSDDHCRDKKRTIEIFRKSGYNADQAERLFQMTKRKGEIYLRLVEKEKEIIEKIMDRIVSRKNTIQIVRKHDGILLIGDESDINEMSINVSQILENDEVVFHQNLWYKKNTFLINRTTQSAL